MTPLMELILIWALSALGGMTVALAFIPYEYNTELSIVRKMRRIASDG